MVMFYYQQKCTLKWTCLCVARQSDSALSGLRYEIQQLIQLKTVQNTNTGSSKRDNSVSEIFENCMKFKRIHFSRIGNHREQSGKRMHAEKN